MEAWQMSRTPSCLNIEEKEVEIYKIRFKQ